MLHIFLYFHLSVFFITEEKNKTIGVSCDSSPWQPLYGIILSMKTRRVSYVFTDWPVLSLFRCTDHWTYTDYFPLNIYTGHRSAGLRESIEMTQTKTQITTWYAVHNNSTITGAIQMRSPRLLSMACRKRTKVFCAPSIVLPYEPV